jgi:hypothetical protein
MASNARFGAITHPLAVSFHIRGQAFSAVPNTNFGVSKSWKQRRLVSELGRDLNECLIDQDSQWVEIGRLRIQAEPLGLQRDRTAACKRIDNRR